jgi:hypothetical protein
MRRILIDRADLEKLIERCRQTAPLDWEEAAGRLQRGHFTSKAPRRKPGPSPKRQATALPASQATDPKVPPVGDAPDVVLGDVHQRVSLAGVEGDYWTNRMRNSVSVNGLFRCCLKQIAHYEQVRGSKVLRGTILPCPFCHTEIVFRGGWERR